MHNPNPLSKKEFYKTADVGDSDFSYEELGQPPATPPKEQTPPTAKEEPKKEAPKEEEPKPEPKKEEAPKKEEKGNHPHVDKVNGNPGAYWIPNMQGFEASALDAIKTGGTVFKGSVAFQGDDWADNGEMEIYLNRGPHNKLHVLLNPQGFIDEVSRVAEKYDAVAKTESEGHVFHPRRCIPFVLENIGKRIVDILGSKLRDVGVKSGLDFKMKDSAPYATAVAEGRALLSQVSRELSDKNKEEAKAPKTRVKKLDTDGILEKFFNELPDADWEVHESKTLGIKTKTTSLPPEKYAPIKEVLDGLQVPMGKVGPYQFEKRQDGNLLVIDTNAYRYSGWVGPELTRLSELVGDDLSKNASAAIAGLTSRFLSPKVK